MQISYSVYPKISEENNLQSVAQGYYANTEGLMQMERDRDNMMPDHVHMLVSIPPKYSISQIMGYIKGKSAMMIFERHANLKYKFGNRNFWATGYYVSTVGLNTATIQKYIREQDKQDQIEDSLSKKEYQDPFKGSK